MCVLKLFHTRQFTEEINRLRIVSFSGQYPSGSSRDSFDDKSYFVLARIDGELAAGARLTPEPGGFYATCLSDSTAIAKESDSVDFNRVHIAPQYRGQGRGLVELIMLDGLLTCAALGFHRINGGYHPHKRRKAYFRDFGFAEVGSVVQFLFESGYSEPIQLILLEVSSAQCATWMQRKVSVIGRLKERGFQVDDKGCNAATPAFKSANPSVP